MSTVALEGLRDYLIGTLSISDMLWLNGQLADYAKKEQESPLKPLTMEEINAMLDEAERNFDAGLGIPNEVVMQEWEEEMERAEQEERNLRRLSRHETEYAEAV